jgi:hypothetical protein
LKGRLGDEHAGQTVVAPAVALRHVARDHYVPALVLGRFSRDTVSRLRERRLFVCREGKVFQAKAGTIGLVNRLYDVTSTGLILPAGVMDPRSVDPIINGYEPELPAALNQLDDGAQIPLQPWLRVLVPFVATMFARGKDFGLRFEQIPRVKAVLPFTNPDNTNIARILEQARLLAPVICARWVVLHQAGRESFIINNFGLMPTLDHDSAQEGFAIPISRHSVLGIFPRPSRTVAWYDGGWQAIIEHRRLDAAEVAGFNHAMATCATEWIAGAERDVIIQNVKFLAVGPPDPAVIMYRRPFDSRTRVAHQFEWQRLVSATTGDPVPEELPDLQAFDPRCLDGGWSPPLMWMLNMKEFPTGLRRTGPGIQLTLRAPSNFEAFRTSAMPR